MSQPRQSPSATPARPTLLYQISLALVAATMAVLPCLYAAFTALAIYGVYWFAANEFAAVWQWPIGMNRLTLPIKFVCSFTPLFVGGAVALAMIKPFFARRPARMHPLALDPQIEPHVYAMVRDICGIVGAPIPQRVELNCDLNASAGFARGLGGFFGNRLILTLGMPLIAGLTQRELAGVIAHEFGHFRQGAGMRLSYLIWRVNLWFARVVYERDAWDVSLAEWAGGADVIWVNIMLGCVQMGVSVSRGVLWLLMMGGHAVSAVLSRQMEYDADRQSILLGGSAAFETTTFKLAALGGVMQDLTLEMRRTWRNKFQLPDNLPILVEYRAARMPTERRIRFENELALTKTHPLDTHPSASDRVRRARQLAAPGYGISDAPARELFENFDNLSRLVTLAHYADDLNVPTQADFLIPVDQMLQADVTRAQAEAARTGGAAPEYPTVAGVDAGMTADDPILDNTVEASLPAETAAASVEPVKSKVRMLVFDPSQLPGKKPSEG